MLRASLLIILISFSSEAWASQILNIVNPDTDVLTAKISNYDSNRIRIAGGYISTAVGPNNGIISIDKDDNQGQVFIRINNPNSKRFTLFITSATGKSYSLLLTPRSMPGQSIILKPRFQVKHSKTKPVGISHRVSDIKYMVRTISNNDIPKHCDLKEKSIIIPWWKNSKLFLTQQMNCNEWIIDKYLLTNTGLSDMMIAEQEFFHDGVVAVSINHTYLSATIPLHQNESTVVWVIRDKHHD